MSKNKELLIEIYGEDLNESIFFENPSYDSAIIGVTTNFEIVYSYNKMIEFLVNEENSTYEEAEDFVCYDTLRALPYISGKKPLIIYDLEEI